MSLLATAAFGVGGLVIILLMQFMTLQSYASDAVDKHGIAEVHASRLGGVALVSAVLMSLALFIINGDKGSEAVSQVQDNWPIWFGAAGCFTLGLIEDLRNNSLSPRFRLISKATVLAMVFLLAPELIPSSIGLPGVDWLLSIPFIAFVVCLFFSVGFINAVNTVDGANGLVIGIFVINCYIFTAEMDGIALPAGLYGASLFLIFNVVSGRLFLGDAGAYAIGSAMLVTGLTAFSEGVVSLPFLAVLFFYPCVDFSVSLIRRCINGESITAPDNDHLHNRVYAYFKSVFKSKNMANSATGLSIAAGSSGIALVGYVGELIPISSNLWFFVFLAQCGLYGLIFVTAGKPSNNSQQKRT
jgi:UDP-N-acetylmuramyl pentapeptide phosphotransferase/UDP-N-acetylglucosamine-1-phosphate transferase